MTLKRTQILLSPRSLLHSFQARTFRQQRNLSQWWEEVEQERQLLWPGRGRAQLRTEHPTRTGPSLFWKTLLWSRARLNQAPLSTSSVLQKVLNLQKADGVHVCGCPGSLYHWSGSGNPMCCHKEATPEEGPAAVLWGVWYLQVCSVPQQRQASSLRHRVQVRLPDRHVWH